MLGDYRKLSTHNQLRQEPEIKTRVKMFKGKGQWLTTLLVAVGAAVAVQGQASAHAATTDSVGPSSDTFKPADGGVVAAKTAPTVRLNAASRATATVANGEQVASPVTKTADAANPEAAAPSANADQSAAPADDNATQPVAEPAASATARQSSESGIAADDTKEAAQANQAGQASSDASDNDINATQEPAPAAKLSDTPADAARNEQKGDTPADTAAVDNHSTATEDDAKVQSEVKTAVDPVSASLIDSIDWTKTTGVPGGLQAPIVKESILNSDGKTYTLAINPANGGAGYPLFNNWVADSDAPETHFMYTYATGLTSQYYMRDLDLDSDGDEDTKSFISLEHDPTANQLYYGTGSDGTQYVRQDLEDKAHNLTITEIVNIDPSGAFNHTVFVKNNGTDALTNVKFGTELDTAFGSGLSSEDVNDGVPIISNGDGSAYLPNETSAKNPNLTIFVTPTGNDTLIAGAWGGEMGFDIKLPKAAAGTANGTALNTPEMDEAAGVRKDTAVQYETPVVSIAPGASISYSYSEHLYLTPVETGTITLEYQDENHAELQPSTVIGGAVGSAFSVTPEQQMIDGYRFVRAEGTVSNFTKDPQTVILIFTNQPEVSTQSATVTYQDVTNNNQTLGAVDTTTGDAGANATYSSAERIEEYKKLGYKLITDGTKDGIVFDSDDATVQPFVVKLAHDVVDVTPDDPHDADPQAFSATATRVINYVNTSDPTKVPAQTTQTQTVTLTRTGTEDLVTKEVTYSGWEAATVEAVASPEVAGYTPDLDTVAADTFTTPDADAKPSATVTVTYTADEQVAVINFVDQNNNTVLPSQSITGKTNMAIDHGQIAAKIQAAMAKGYTLSTDGTVGATFDHATDKNQSFVVTFVPVENASVTTNLIPEGPDGTQLTPTEPKTVTGKPSDPISETDYPDVPGYTPNENQNKVVPNEPGDTVITYTPDVQKAVVTFVDKAGNTVAPSQTISGPTDTAIDHGTINIQAAMNAGYTVAQDGTVGAKFDHNTDGNQIFVVTLVPIEKAGVTTNLVPHDPKGNPLTPTTPTTVTGTPGAPISAEDYPDVPGYTPAENQNVLVPNEPGDTIINYTPNTQTATVQYLDESGQPLLAPEQAITGPSDTAVVHGDIAPNIQKVINQGYKITVDGTVGATFDHDDGHDQKFTVVFSKNSAPTTSGGQGGGGTTPPPATGTTGEEPGLPSTFGGTTPNTPGRQTSGTDEPTDEPSLPSTFGGVATDDPNGKSETAASSHTAKQQLVATRQAGTKAQAKPSIRKVAATSVRKTLPQTGERHATGLVMLGATLMLLLGLADWRRERGQ